MSYLHHARLLWLTNQGSLEHVSINDKSTIVNFLSYSSGYSKIAFEEVFYQVAEENLIAIYFRNAALFVGVMTDLPELFENLFYQNF